MQLDHLALHLRRRRPWEAMDLGCAMVRNWWRPVLTAWLPLYLSVALTAHAIFYDKPIVAILILWWLKPVFDRAPLEVLSRAVFGAVPRAAEVLRAIPRSPGLLASLTIYRFDLARSFDLPVWHLERLRGTAARRRARSLQRRARGHAVWLTVIFVHFELVIALALWGALDLFTPVPYDTDFGLQGFFSSDAPLWRQWLESAFYMITVTLLEPFYVGAGFALYLNRRTELEAWDVELALRRFANREPALRRVAALAAGVLMAWVIAAAISESAYAAGERTRSPQATIREILAHPEFDQYRDTTRFRYLGRGSGDEEPSGKSDRTPRRGSGITLVEWIAEGGRVLMWALVIALAVAALFAARRYLTGWSLERADRPQPRAALFGLDIAPESLPADVAGAALAAVRSGHAREGLGLLYRGALSRLVNDDGLEVAPGDTEGECVQRVAAHVDSGKARFFGELVSAWQSAAYARRLPGTDALSALCHGWHAHFGQRE